MRVAITGASGLIGRALSKALVERGDEVVAARRGSEGELRWDTKTGFDPPDALSGFDAVVHLAGENVGDGRWTDERKASLRSSRIDGTRSVVAAIAAADPRPRIFVSASGSNIYRDDTTETLDEDGPHGTGFLAELVEAWEAEAQKAEGVRLVIARMGAVLDPASGALARMLPFFRMGVGGPVGGGEQPMSWVHSGDVVQAMLWFLDRDDARGIYNLSSPEPTSNADFSRALGKAVHRPAFLPVPTFALRILYGEMADVVLHGQRIVPRRLLDEGFRFRFGNLDEALADLTRSSPVR